MIKPISDIFEDFDLLYMLFLKKNHLGNLLHQDGLYIFDLWKKEKKEIIAIVCFFALTAVTYNLKRYI